MPLCICDALAVAVVLMLGLPVIDAFLCFLFRTLDRESTAEYIPRLVVWLAYSWSIGFAIPVLIWLCLVNMRCGCRAVFGSRWFEYMISYSVDGRSSVLDGPSPAMRLPCR